jgi:hypothetical protein
MRMGQTSPGLTFHASGERHATSLWTRHVAVQSESCDGIPGKGAFLGPASASVHSELSRTRVLSGVARWDQTAPAAVWPSLMSGWPARMPVVARNGP